MLEQLLTQGHLLKDVVVYGVSKLASGGSTYFQIQRRGLESVGDVDVRQDMKKNGVSIVVLENSLKTFVKGLIVGGGLLAADYGLGIENEYVNLHHAFIYSISLVNVVSSLSNVVRAFRGSNEQIEVQEQLNPEKLNKPFDMDLLRGLDDYQSRADEARLLGAIKRFRNVAKRGEITDEEVIKLYKVASENPMLRGRYFNKDSGFNLLEQYLLAKDLIKQPSVPKAVQFLDKLDGKQDGKLKILDWAKKLAF